MGYLGYKPADKPLTSADITDGIVTTTKIADGTITNTDLASSIITGQTAETSIAGGDSILIYDDSATALRKMTRTNFVAGVGGTNTPNFKANRTSSQSSIANGTETKIQFNNEVFDTASAYDNATNYRFTVPSGQGGKYLIIASVQALETSGVPAFTISIKKNGSSYIFEGRQSGDTIYAIANGSGIAELSATDYIEAFVYHEFGSTISISGNPHDNHFSAFKIIE